MVYVIKAIAAALMVASGYFFGKSLEQKLKDRHKTLVVLSEAIYYLKTKICSEGYPLPEALRETQEKYFTEESSVFNLAAENIDVKHMPAEEAWDKALDLSLLKAVLAKEDMEILKNAGTLLGSGDVQVQKDNLEELTEKLKNSAENALYKLKKDGTLYIKVGLAIGSIIAVFMW